MPVSAATGTQQTIDSLVLRAYQMAGLEDKYGGGPGNPDWEQKAAFGRVMLNSLVKYCMTLGMQPRFYANLDVETVEGQQSYVVPVDIVDLGGMAVYVPEGEDANASASQQPLAQVNRETWTVMSGKNETGIPSLYYYDKATPAGVYTASVRFYPIPDVDDAVIRFQAQRRVFDSLDGAATVDLDGSWELAILTALSSMLARSDGARVMANELDDKAMFIIDSTLMRNKSGDGPINVSIDVAVPGLWRTR